MTKNRRALVAAAVGALALGLLGCTADPTPTPAPTAPEPEPTPTETVEAAPAPSSVFGLDCADLLDVADAQAFFSVPVEARPHPGLDTLEGIPVVLWPTGYSAAQAGGLGCVWGDGVTGGLSTDGPQAHAVTVLVLPDAREEAQAYNAVYAEGTETDLFVNPNCAQEERPYCEASFIVGDSWVSISVDGADSALGDLPAMLNGLVDAVTRVIGEAPGSDVIWTAPEDASTLGSCEAFLPVDEVMAAVGTGGDLQARPAEGGGPMAIGSIALDRAESGTCFYAHPELDSSVITVRSLPGAEWAWNVVAPGADQIDLVDGTEQDRAVSRCAEGECVVDILVARGWIMIQTSFGSMNEAVPGYVTADAKEAIDALANDVVSAVRAEG